MAVANHVPNAKRADICQNGSSRAAPAKMAASSKSHAKHPAKLALANFMPKKFSFFLIFFSCNADSILYNQGKEREKEKMKTSKIPSVSTIRKNINRYAYNAGFTYHPQTDGTVSLFSIRAKYYVFRGSPERVVQFVIDELSMQNWRKAGYPS